MVNAYTIKIYRHRRIKTVWHQQIRQPKQVKISQNLGLETDSPQQAVRFPKKTNDECLETIRAVAE